MTSDTVKAIPAPKPRVGSMPQATLPEPPPAAPIPPGVAAAATGMPEVLSLTGVHAKLCKPFHAALIELKPGAMTKDKTRAIAMPFVDIRAYQTRLDRVVGVEGWSNRYVATDRGVVCELTILGVTKSAIGDYPISGEDENPATSAEAQAFKRACSAFGLGRYLYRLPQIWADYDQQKKQFASPAGLVAQMYATLPANGEE